MMSDSLRKQLSINYVRRVHTGKIPTIIVWRCPITNATMQRAEYIKTFAHTRYCKWCEVEHYFSAKDVHIEPYDPAELLDAFAAGVEAERDPQYRILSVSEAAMRYVQSVKEKK